jgi:hypothetical protein
MPVRHESGFVAIVWMNGKVVVAVGQVKYAAHNRGALYRLYFRQDVVDVRE